MWRVRSFVNYPGTGAAAPDTPPLPCPRGVTVRLDSGSGLRTPLDSPGTPSRGRPMSYRMLRVVLAGALVLRCGAEGGDEDRQPEFDLAIADFQEKQHTQ